MDQQRLQRRHRDRERYRRNPKRRFNKYRDNARRRNLYFALDYDEALRLFVSMCFYCGKQGTLDDELVGIDRVDSGLPYTSDNCVACCPDCNMMKGTLPSDTFIEKCREVAAHMQ
jgi:5-methylcytosine-specific restriction endonuclease McrA